MDKKRIAMNIIHDLSVDICDRNGIGDELKGMDEKTYNEMIQNWEQIIYRIIGQPDKENCNG